LFACALELTRKGQAGRTGPIRIPEDMRESPETGSPERRPGWLPDMSITNWFINPPLGRLAGKKILSYFRWGIAIRMSDAGESFVGQL
jgi:hypothetical protein